MTGEYISVKEYAARHKMTEQAVYKKISSGKLRTVEQQKDGKRKKYILDAAPDPLPLSGHDRAQELAEDPPGSHDAAAEDPARPSRSDGPQSAAAAHMATRDPAAEALGEAVAALRAQLEEKDRQIARLQELLNQSQQLQARALLGQPKAETEQINVDQAAAATPDPAEEQTPPKKRGFWARLFGLE